jgi:hypothetical protein
MISVLFGVYFAFNGALHSFDIDRIRQFVLRHTNAIFNLSRLSSVMAAMMLLLFKLK